ncbi:hypothetical protein D3C76_1738630 [compost metagenome]
MALLTRGRKRFYRRVTPSVTNDEKIASSRREIFREEKAGGGEAVIRLFFNLYYNVYIVV